MILRFKAGDSRLETKEKKLVDLAGRRSQMSNVRYYSSISKARRPFSSPFCGGPSGQHPVADPLSLGSGRFGGDNFRLFDHGRFYKKLLGLGEQGFCNFTRKMIIAPLRIRKCIEDTELRGTELKRIPAGCSSFRHRHRECRL